MYPFERFTEAAKRVLTLAQEEAERSHHSYIGTEHILLGNCFASATPSRAWRWNASTSTSRMFAAPSTRYSGLRRVPLSSKLSPHRG